MNRIALFTGALLVASTLLSPLGIFASSGAPILTTTYTLLGSPRQSTLNGIPCIKANYLNAAGSNTAFGVVYAVVHNPLGQIVLMAPASITPAARANATAFLMIAGLPRGVYSVSVFAVDQNEIAISLSSSIQVTL